MSDAGKNTLIRNLADRDSLLVAYSGGVDSSLLAALASEALGGDRIRCVLLDAPVVPRRAVREALATAEHLGIMCEVIPFPIMENDEFRKNPLDRCYICKKISSRLLKARAAEAGIAHVADGVNISDQSEYRPGLAAGNEEGICHPFIETGINKEGIRKIARECGFSFWSKPSDACLATRIPYGEEITGEKLWMIEQAEDFLIENGFTQVRVRLHGTMIRIEIVPQEMIKFLGIKDEVIQTLKRIGFQYVTLDLEGYRSGSMDEVL